MMSRKINELYNYLGSNKRFDLFCYAVTLSCYALLLFCVVSVDLCFVSVDLCFVSVDLCSDKKRFLIEL